MKLFAINKGPRLLLYLSFCTEGNGKAVVPLQNITNAEKKNSLGSISEGFECTGKSFKADGLRQHVS